MTICLGLMMSSFEPAATVMTATLKRAARALGQLSAGSQCLPILIAAQGGSSRTNNLVKSDGRGSWGKPMDVYDARVGNCAAARDREAGTTPICSSVHCAWKTARTPQIEPCLRLLRVTKSATGSQTR